MFLEWQWESVFSELFKKSFPECYREQVHLFDEKLSNSLEFYYMEPDLYLSTAKIVEAVITFFQERHTHSDSCFTINVFLEERKKLKIYNHVKDVI